MRKGPWHRRWRCDGRSEDGGGGCPVEVRWERVVQRKVVDLRNGCQVLRKGCSDNCSIRPCLQWIKSPDSQAHATVFLAKFYGCASLINLINSTPDHLRPAVFRSLLYEACGRIVNPIYGSE